MTEKELKAFIDVVTEYFMSVTDTVAEMGVPFIKNQQAVVLDYTGAIGISGARKGAVYLTADKALLKDFAQYLVGEGSVSDESLLDLVGEMTNTIAGNVRKTFGSDFMISVPIILKGNIEDIQVKLRKPIFVIPIEWNNHRSFLTIGLE